MTLRGSGAKIVVWEG